MFWKLQEDILKQNDFKNLTNFIKTTKRFTQFTKVREFETEFAKWQGCKYCVYVNSGSSANLLLINAWKTLKNWSNQDEIIVPAVTWSTNIAPVIQNNLIPVFVDVNLNDLSFNYEQLENSITPKTKAIFITHLLGFPADINKIKKIIGNRDIIILEDCCESQGAQIGGIKVGNFGDGSAFSFYWGHHMTTVEGGMICTNDENFYKMLLLKRSHGLARELPKKYHKEIKKLYPDIDFRFLFLTDGFNVRNTELHAVIGLAQLKKIDSFIQARNENYKLFLDICSNYDDLILIKSEGMSAFVFQFIFKNKKKKEEFQKFIAENGIESRPLISGNLLRQPFLKKYYDSTRFKKADFLHTNAFYIGNNQFVNKDRMNLLDSLMKRFFGKK
ncbi:MAG: CDP-4-keto-6-deoxy-D-glucose-3-dehydrase [Candidatus Moranbacteria bacterium CG10_big_fil_rev_8_21_14_0_10_35_21]|nr:MAG: CDP-4-keto-6-deoxy-D-glucose-3-dehydrase [Candidatus Moranbacteria bacterium CG10_big_fil_rev_8_21_14_0_10_35_21]PJA88260.1 MAG: CDP-4-keto-6-deoxy-D-glucose-3-dehydrase [Candidatus Moranbacteria bacterium CG_4_9_14_3_um_filter_36_9]